MVQMGKDPSEVLTAPSIERFERLIKEVNSRYEKHKAGGSKTLVAAVCLEPVRRNWTTTFR
jgi:hypothetical protein